MSIFDKIKEKPFLLSDSDVQWVKDTLAGMTEKQKIGQIFCLCAREGTEQEIEDTLQVMEPGGIMYRPFTAEQAVNFTAMLDKAMKIPMLISANLEKGGNGIVSEGTMLGSPTEIAATDDVKFAERLGTICGREGAAVGANWAFAPHHRYRLQFPQPHHQHPHLRFRSGAREEFRQGLCGKCAEV